MGNRVIYIYALMAALLLASTARAQAPATSPAPSNAIAEIRVDGAEQMTDRAVLTRIKTRIGQQYDPELVKQDVQLLLQSRRFDSVTTTAQQTPAGVILTFVVVERPVIKELAITGNKEFKTTELIKDIPFGTGDAIDQERLATGRQALLDKYRDKGYPDASVTLDEAAVRNGKVIYTIVEGPQTTVRKIIFEGNTFFSELFKLRPAVTSQSRFWPFIKGYLDVEKADQDVDILRNLYISEGFLDAEVAREIQFITPDKSKAHLIFHIKQGPRYRVNEIRFRGNTVFSDADLSRRTELRRGSFYTIAQLQADLKAIENSYGEIGFIEAKVDFERLFLSPDEPTPAWAATANGDKPALLNLVFTLRENDQYSVGKIDIRGNTVTQDRVIRRELRLYPQQLFNSVAMEESRKRLQESGLYEENSVIITPVPSGQPDTRDVLVNVKEGRTAQFMIGVGVSSNDGLVGDISFTQRNFDISNRGGWDELMRGRAWKGAGQTFRISARPGTELNSASIEWHTPYIGDLPFAYGVKGFVFERGRESYDESRFGVVNSIGHRFKNRWYGELANRIEGVRVDDLDDDAPPEVFADEGSHLLIGFKGSLTRDRTDSRIMPSTGDRLRFSYEQVVGDYTFGVAEADYRFYFTLWSDALNRKHILASRLAVGQIVGDAPIFEKFYGGGLGSIRGFKYRGIGPRSGRDDDPIGGDFMFYAGTEYTFPLIGQQLRGVLFLDTGTVEEDFGFSDYRASIGPGIRWIIPFLGQVPLSLDFGFPLLKSDGDDTRIFSFSFGATF